MPWYDPRDYKCKERESQIQKLYDDKKERDNQVQKLTRVACDLANALKHVLAAGAGSVSKETSDWVAEHDASDANKRA